MNERSKGKPNFFQRQANEIVDGLIAIRQSGEPFFGVQSSGKQISSLDEDRPSEYHVQQMFRPREDTVTQLF